jgi:hypothetical protein
MGCPKPQSPPRQPEPSQPPLAEAPLSPTGAARFEIGPLDWKRTVRNTGTRSTRDLKVWVDGLDGNGARLARSEALPTPQEVPPGGAASFVLRMPNDPAIQTFHVEAIGR